jgi:hypothetical protein
MPGRLQRRYRGSSESIPAALKTLTATARDHRGSEWLGEHHHAPTPRSQSIGMLGLLASAGWSQPASAQATLITSSPAPNSPFGDFDRGP